MNTRILMSTSAIWNGIVGAGFLFVSAEIMALIDIQTNQAMELIMQAFGAALLGWAMLNWMAKGILIGGIYARPVALGNFLSFTAPFISLFKFDLDIYPFGWVLLPVYGFFAISFAKVLFTHPKTANPDSNT
ncbi:MAG: hypothetical protein JXQ90_18845 [Cyclobacteriaceae bacterium]